MQDFLKGRAHSAPLNPAARIDPAPRRHDAHRSPHFIPISAPASAPHAPQVEIISEDGRVDRIIVTCACGEHITLQCAY